MRNKLGLVVVGVALGSLLSACSSMPDAVNPISWYRDATGASKNDDLGKGENEQNLQEGDNEPYPNLGSVPNAPDTQLSGVDRDKLVNSLVADRSNAQYSADNLRAGEVASTVPPPPAATPANSSNATVGGASSTSPSAPPVAAAPAANTSAPPSPSPVASAPAAPSTPAPAATASAPPPAAASAPTASTKPAASPTAQSGNGTKTASNNGRSSSAKKPPPRGSEAPPPESSLQSPAIPNVPQGETATPPPPLPNIPPPNETAAATPTPTPAAPAPSAATPEPAKPLNPPPAPKQQATAPANTPPVTALHRPAISYRVADVSFVRGSSSISDGTRSTIAEIVKLHNEDGGTIRIVGHGEATGKDAAMAGFTLALDRAQAVAVALTDAGVAAKDIAVETAPVAARGGTDAPRAEVYLEH